MTELLPFLVPLGVAALLLARPLLRRAPAPAERWVVRVVPAIKKNYWDYDREGDPIDGEVAVRVMRGREVLTIGTFKLADDAFDAELQRAISHAEDRAATLNACAEEAQ